MSKLIKSIWFTSTIAEHCSLMELQRYKWENGLILWAVWNQLKHDFLQNHWHSQRLRGHTGVSRWRSSRPWLWRRGKRLLNYLTVVTTKKKNTKKHIESNKVKKTSQFCCQFYIYFWALMLNLIKMSKLQKKVEASTQPASCRAVLPWRSTFPTGLLCCKNHEKQFGSNRTDRTDWSHLF